MKSKGKTGENAVCGGMACAAIDKAARKTHKEDNYFDIDFSDWKNHTNGNVALIILLFFGLAGLALIVLSIAKRRKEKTASL